MTDLILVLATVIVLTIYCLITISLTVFYIRKSVENIRILRYSSPDICMCGADMGYESHWNENHGPISEYSYYSRRINQMKADFFWIK